MKAIQISSYGGSEVLVEDENLSEPQISTGQILVEVYAFSLNPFDWKLISGIYKNNIPVNFPFRPGGDFSGKIIKTGGKATPFKADDEVYGSASALSGGSGSFAEKAASKENNSALKPGNTDFIQAASLPLAGVSAMEVIEDKIELLSGEKILIHGGAGGIGSLAVQLAKSKGALVAATVRKEDMDFVRGLGADIVIDYQSGDFETKIKDYDAVFDTAGGEVTSRSFPVLKKGGVIVSMLGEPDPKLADQYGVKAIGQMTVITKEKLERLKEFVEKGKVKPQVDRVFDFGQIKEAMDFAKESHPEGKVVVKIKG